MLAYNKQAKKRPVGGEQYPEYGMTFRGETFPEVVNKLRSFRINNNIPVGDPEQEILQYYAVAFPWMVKEDFERDVSPSVSPDYESWRQWIYDTWKTPPKNTVTQKEAEFRAASCINCPHNKPLNWKKTEELEGLKARTYMLRKGQGTYASRVGYCSHHRADISAFVFCDPAEEFSKAPAKAEYAECWIGKRADLLTVLKSSAPLQK